MNFIFERARNAQKSLDRDAGSTAGTLSQACREPSQRIMNRNSKKKNDQSVVYEPRVGSSQNAKPAKVVKPPKKVKPFKNPKDSKSKTIVRLPTKKASVLPKDEQPTKKMIFQQQAILNTPPLQSHNKTIAEKLSPLVDLGVDEPPGDKIQDHLVPKMSGLASGSKEPPIIPTNQHSILLRQQRTPQLQLPLREKGTLIEASDSLNLPLAQGTQLTEHQFPPASGIENIKNQLLRAQEEITKLKKLRNSMLHCTSQLKNSIDVNSFPFHNICDYVYRRSY